MPSKPLEYTVSAAFLLVGIWILYYTGTVFVEAGYGGGDSLQNAAFFPRMIAYALIILSVLTTVSLAMGRQSPPSEDGVLPPVEPARFGLALAHLGLVAVYLSVVRYVGYDLSTPIFLFAQFMLLGARWIESIILGIGVSLILSVIFEQGLNVVFPVGRLGLAF